jgi:stage II sporulation protein D
MSATPSRRRGALIALLALLSLPSTSATLLIPAAAFAQGSPASESEISPGAYVGFFGAAVAHPPYPDVWDANPLRFPYAPDEATFLPPAPRREAVSGRVGSFSPPGEVMRAVRILVQPQARAVVVLARDGADLQWRSYGGQARRGPAVTGGLRVERRGGNFVVTPTRGVAVSGGNAVAMRLAPSEGGAPLEVNGKSYRGALEFHPEGAGFIVVNVLPLEEYLRGVLPLEMGRHEEARIEALKTQAVAARTYAVKRALERRGELFDLYASVQDQVYGGAAAEHPVCDRAVRETAGIVLLHGDTLALAYYHSTCGGRTAARHEAWGGEPIAYLQSVPDLDPEGRPWCRASRYMEWSQSWDLDALAGIVRKNLPDAGVRTAPPFREITGFEVRSRRADGRIDALEIRTDRGPIVVRGDKTRWALRPAPGTGRILESSRFDIEIRGGRAVASGSGFGHGVGMCQMGALARAQAGQSYAEILQAYYPGTELAKLTGR